MPTWPGAVQIVPAGAASTDDAAELVDGVRRGIRAAFEAATAEFDAEGGDARAVSDDLMRGLRTLPLVL